MTPDEKARARAWIATCRRALGPRPTDKKDNQR